MAVIVLQTFALPFIVSAQTTPTTPTPTSTYCGLTQKLLDITGISDLFNSLQNTLSSLIGSGVSAVTGGATTGIGILGVGTLVPVAEQGEQLAHVRQIRTDLDSITTKEFVCDPVLRFVASLLIRSLTNTIIAWIQGNGGEDVGFVGNFEAEFRKQLDARGGELLNQLAGVNLCGNIGAFLQISLRTGTSLRQKLQCTVTDIVENVGDFFNDFSQGGWPAFIRMSLQPQNNPYGAFLIALDAKLAAEGAAGRALERKLLANKGYSGVRTPANGICDVGNDGILRCTIEYFTKTPGHLVANMLERTIGSGYDYAIVADEFNEALEAIITTLIFTLVNSAEEGIFNPALADSPVTTDVNILTIITTSLPSGVLKIPYTATLTAINGELPYTWNISSGSLPPGSPAFALSPEGHITGTPTVIGTYAFTVKVADIEGRTDFQNLTIQIFETPPTPKPPPGTPLSCNGVFTVIPGGPACTLETTCTAFAGTCHTPLCPASAADPLQSVCVSMLSDGTCTVTGEIRSCIVNGVTVTEACYISVRGGQPEQLTCRNL